MSASQDKKRRQMEREAGIDRRTIAEREEAENKRKSKIKWTIGATVSVVLVVLILVANSNLFYNVIPSVKVGEKSYTNSEYQYYYYSSYYQFCNDYSDYLSYFLDTSKPLDEQAFDGTFLSMFGVTVPESVADPEKNPDATWADYFRETALIKMAQTTSVYEKAVAEGYSLSEEDSAEIDAQIADFETYAASYGYSSAKNYISAAYGRGCNEKVIRELMEMSYIASDYSADSYESFIYTPEELAAWYAENKNTYDTFDYTYYLVSAETVEVVSDVTDEETGEVTQETKNETKPETMATAKATADALAASVNDEASFAAAVARIKADAVPVPQKQISGYNLTSVYSEWMLDASRRSGDVTVAESEGTGYYVVLFQNRDDNSYNTVSVRHILVKAVDEDEDGAYNEAEMAKARAAIETIYDEWKSGEATEDSFSALANEKSEDTGSNTNGGLYENIYKGQMVAEFNDFCFAHGRKPGDVGIVKGEASSYAGYHIIYFVGEGLTFSDYLADTNLRNDDFSEWQASSIEGYEAVANFVLRFAQK